METIDYERPFFYPKQEEAIFCTERYSWIEASTKSGKTVGCLGWIYEDALLRGFKNRHWWWVAPVYPQAAIAYRRLEAAMEPGTFRSNKTDHYFELFHGSYIWFKTGEKPDNLYGEDVYGAVFDEASRSREESFFALRSTLSFTRGPLKLIGNVRGKKNWFWKGCRQAEAGKVNHRYSKITADDAVKAGVLDATEIEDARQTLPENVFKELYYANATDDGSNPFGDQNIMDCIGPMSERPAVAYGVDLAKKRDWTVIIGLDENNMVCKFIRFQKTWDETLHIIAQIVGTTPALIDSTGVGDAIVEQLQRKIGESIQGYHFTPIKKQQLVEGLAVDIQSLSITFPDNEIVSEALMFEIEYLKTTYRYQAIEGYFDDSVISLALARQCKQNLYSQGFGVV